MRLSDLLAVRAHRTPELDAVQNLADGPVLKWAEWHRESRRAAHCLRAAGVGEGSRVCLMLPRSPLYLVWLLACWEAGAVAVPLDPACTRAELEGFVQHADPSLAVIHGRQPGLEDIPCGILDASTDRLLRPAVAVQGSPQEDALVMYTSGSTGSPKAVRLTHRNVIASLLGLRRAFRLGPATRILSTLALHTSHGLFMHALSGLVHGGTLVIGPLLGPFEAAGVWELANRCAASFFSTVPTVLSTLVSLTRGRPPSDLLVLSASAPLPGDLRQAFAARFGVPIINCFGMTETAGWALYGSAGAPDGSVGRPLQCRVRVGVPPPGCSEELLIRGRQVTEGGWRDETGSVGRREDGYLCTGDLVRIDEEGWVYHIGRLKRVICRAGRSVHPEDIEAALLSLPQVLEAAVVSAQDGTYGELPRAFVVLRPGQPLAAADVHRYLRSHLSAFRQPRWVELCDSLPTLPGGKTDLQALARRPLPSARLTEGVGDGA